MVVKDPDGKRYLYYFNEGSTAFFEVEEVDSDAIMPKVAEKVETYVRRGWQEFFGALRIVTSIAILLAVEAVNYAINHIASPIFLGVVTTIGNRLLKPLLAAAFNLLLQPVIIFSWNVLSGIRHVFQPVVDVLGAVMSKLAILVQAFRLVEVSLGEDYLLRHKKVIGLGSGARHNIEVWVLNILEKKTESDRIVFEDPDPETGFILLPDMKWNRSDLESLYLVAIVHKHGIHSIRDLRREHLPLLKNILVKGKAAIKEKFNIPGSKLRLGSTRQH
nr:hypothetical protein BaRGS_016458 [Batillaria attramentaria]